jgi:hypothetical protein
MKTKFNESGTWFGFKWPKYRIHHNITGTLSLGKFSALSPTDLVLYSESQGMKKHCLFSRATLTLSVCCILSLCFQIA